MFNLKIKMNNKAQSSLEMAILGSFIIIAMVSLFSYGQKVNDQQYVLMTAFRKALANARSVNGSASYSIIEHHRYTAGDFFRKGSRSAVSGGGSVLWGKLAIGAGAGGGISIGEFGSSSVLKINEDEISPPEGETEIETEAEETTTTAMRKEENPSSISTTHSLDMEDVVTTTFVEKTGKTPITSITQYIYRDSDGKYKYSQNAQGQRVTRSHTWTTPQ